MISLDVGSVQEVQILVLYLYARLLIPYFMLFLLCRVKLLLKLVLKYKHTMQYFFNEKYSRCYGFDD